MLRSLPFKKKQNLSLSPVILLTNSHSSTLSPVPPLLSCLHHPRPPKLGLSLYTTDSAFVQATNGLPIYEIQRSLLSTPSTWPTSCIWHSSSHLLQHTCFPQLTGHPTVFIPLSLTGHSPSFSFAASFPSPQPLVGLWSSVLVLLLLIICTSWGSHAVSGFRHHLYPDGAPPSQMFLLTLDP